LPPAEEEARPASRVGVLKKSSPELARQNILLEYTRLLYFEKYGAQAIRAVENSSAPFCR